MRPGQIALLFAIGVILGAVAGMQRHDAISTNLRPEPEVETSTDGTPTGNLHQDSFSATAQASAWISRRGLPAVVPAGGWFGPDFRITDEAMRVAGLRTEARPSIDAKIAFIGRQAHEMRIARAKLLKQSAEEVIFGSPRNPDYELLLRQDLLAEFAKAGLVDAYHLTNSSEFTRWFEMLTDSIGGTDRTYVLRRVPQRAGIGVPFLMLSIASSGPDQVTQSSRPFVRVEDLPDYERTLIRRLAPPAFFQ